METKASSLNWAVLYEPIEKVRTLLSKPISESEMKDPTTNATILCWVAQRKNDAEAVEIARILVEKHNVNPHEHDFMKQTCLFYAAREGLSELVKYFVSNGCDPNEADKVGQTSLFYAARDGRTESLIELLRLGGNPNQLDNNRQSCLFYAARDGRYDTVRALLEHGVNASIKDNQRRTALTFARGNSHLDIVELLKNAPPHRGGSGHMSTYQQPVVTASPHDCNRPQDTVTTHALSSDSLSKEGMKSEVDDRHDGGGSNTSLKRTAEMCNLPDSNGRQKYRLQYRPLADDHGFWLDAPLEKIDEFERRFPMLVVWPKDQPIYERKPNFEAFKKEWRASANVLMTNLCKYQGAHIFERPVDPKKQSCPDYYDVIERPMSFSCIKRKLRRLEYETPSEFLSDVQLVFDNCSLYNKEGSLVALTGKVMEKYFNNQVLVTRFSNYVHRDIEIRKVMEAPVTSDIPTGGGAVFEKMEDPGAAAVEGEGKLGNTYDASGSSVQTVSTQSSGDVCNGGAADGTTRYTVDSGSDDGNVMSEGAPRSDHVAGPDSNDRSTMASSSGMNDVGVSTPSDKTQGEMSTGVVDSHNEEGVENPPSEETATSNNPPGESSNGELIEAGGAAVVDAMHASHLVDNCNQTEPCGGAIALEGNQNSIGTT